MTCDNLVTKFTFSFLRFCSDNKEVCSSLKPSQIPAKKKKKNKNKNKLW
jgi:hypothetical protein